MSTETSALGTCPHCGEAIPRTRLLIEYDTPEGTATYAECPACHDVVHPA